MNDFDTIQQASVIINNDNELESDEQLIMNLELLSDREDVSIAINNVPVVILDDECEYNCDVGLGIPILSFKCHVVAKVLVALMCP